MLLLCLAAHADAREFPVAPDDVIVTTSKRAENIQDVPISLTAFSENELELAGVYITQDLRLLEPSLVFTTNTAFGQPYLRGVGSDLFTPGAESSIATFVDEIYLPRSVSSLQNFFDIEQVTVVKGPQGVLFGRNAVGGALNLTSRKPTDEFTGSLGLTYGNFDERRIDGHINIPIVEDKISFRAAGLSHNRDGYTKNIQTGGTVDSADLLAFRTHLDVELSDTFDILLSANYSTEDSSRNLAARVNTDGGPAIADVFGAIRPADRFEIAANEDGQLRLDSYGLSALASYDMGWARLKSITGYTDTELRQSVDFDASQLEFARNSGFQNSQSFTQEIQLISQNTSALDWVLGIFYLNEDAGQQISNRLNFPILIPNTLDEIGGRVQTESIGIFGNAKYQIDERWAVSAGIRYNYDKRNLDFVQNTTLFDPFPFGPEGPQGAPLTLPSTNQDEAKFDALTPSFTLEYTPNDYALLYGSVSRGYKAGGFNTNVNQSAFKPESLWAYEIGYKNSFWDDRAQFNTAAFIYDYSDLQLLTVPPGAPTGTFQIVINAAEATIKGVEADLSLAASKSVGFNFAIALLDAEYDNFVATNPNIPTLLDVDRSGERLPRAPEVSFSAGAEFKTTLYGRRLDLRSDMRYESFQFLDAFQDALVARDENISLNAQAKYSLSNSTSLSFWSRNLTNEDTVGSALRVDGLLGVIEFYMPPRSYGVTLNMGF